ncbi:MAG: hypothetical protein PHN49_11525 [Candidatus Omnitrophica bacterium]|nr:hypothetical protein [Candidatus Omnitrophota bacterium]MDD5672260.1 hypothetical protein [Candidatus Omnitrophota bacterium]
MDLNNIDFSSASTSFITVIIVIASLSIVGGIIAYLVGKYAKAKKTAAATEADRAERFKKIREEELKKFNKNVT